MSDLNNNNPSDEFNNVVKSFVEQTKEDAEALKQKKQQMHKCSNDAEAAVAMLRQHKGSGESTAGPSSIASFADSTSGEDLSSSLLNDDAPMPQTLDEAMDHINKLKTMRDSLLEEKNRNDKFVERYKAKVDKQERMAQLHSLIPRQLFVREDRYNEELEKVYKWSGISDQEIADFYNRKLGNSTKFKHHGAASTRDPYHNFREVPDFSKVNGKNLSSSSYSTTSSSNTNSVLRDLEFMKKIAGGGGGNN